MQNLAQEVVVTNSLNLTTILAVVSAVSIIGGAVVIMFFKLVRQVMKEIFETRIELIKQTQALLRVQTAEIQQCIHKIPGHPENPNTTSETTVE